LRDKLRKQHFDLWEEDNEQLKNELSSIISKGTETRTFNLQDYHNRVQLAVNKRTQDIENILQKYKWLRRNRYVSQVANLKNRYKKFSVFQSEIENIRKSRGLFTKLYEMIFYK